MKVYEGIAHKPCHEEKPCNLLQKKYPDMPNTEKAALCDYTRGDVSDFLHLNKELMVDRLSEFNVAFSDFLSNALSKLPTEEAIVYRTIRLNRTSLFIVFRLVSGKILYVYIVNI